MGAVEHPIQFRVLPLQGGLNLRDMGGYSTGDGRRVKTGMLYRSGRMSSLTDADEAHLAGLGIRSVCDLRNTDERSRHPTRWCAAGATELWARDYEDYSGQLDKLMRKDDATVDEVVAGLSLNFVPDPVAAVAEMGRVLTSGGRATAYVWDYAEGMQMLRLFWDAATAENPQAAFLDEGTRFPLCEESALSRCFTKAGL